MDTDTAVPGATGGERPDVAGSSRPQLVLPSFEGPLDLLLHLIRANEISITDIPIQEICRQYDEYLGLMRDLSLEIAGDYLLMASTLMHIKSRMLLPVEPTAPGEEPEDPRAELVRQLLEYQKVKLAAEMLRDRKELQSDTFPRGHGGEDPLEPYREDVLLEVSLFDLLSAFKRLVESLGDDTPLTVHRDEISVAEKISWILEELELVETSPFMSLLSKLTSRRERIAAFLALLELIRLRLVTAHQHRSGGEILLRKLPATEEPESGQADES